MFESQFHQLFKFEILGYKQHVVVIFDRFLKFAEVKIDFLRLELAIVAQTRPVVTLNDDIHVNARI